ncbi:MAG: pyridoxal-phosphate dependent enzyme [Planctomycetota bacterium]|jgi:threonine dehydratase|nr:pyridoxal-phosphate dependent enzyme [Planctomycetota bacterium]
MSGYHSERPSLDDIRAAARRIEPHIHRTPVLTCQAIDQVAGCEIFLKCENLQKVGAFKARGASNAVFSLTDDEASHGVVTHSSGNHAQALAWAAGRRGIPAHIVMPTNAPMVKKNAVLDYGGIVHDCEPTLESRLKTCARVAQETGGTVIPPYDDDRVIAGQGTIALEFLGQVPDLDAIVVPVGGGGMISGIAICAKALSPRLEIIGAEPELADDAARSFFSGRIEPHAGDPTRTIADGLRTTLGERTFPVIQDLVDDIIAVPESAIREALRLVMERAKLVIEPSAAVGIAAVRSEALRAKGHRRIGVVLCGGNLDLDALPSLL